MIRFPDRWRTWDRSIADFDELVNPDADKDEETQQRQALDDASGEIRPAPNAGLLALPADPRPHTSQGVFGVVVGDVYWDAVGRHCRLTSFINL